MVLALLSLTDTKIQLDDISIGTAKVEISAHGGGTVPGRVAGCPARAAGRKRRLPQGAAIRYHARKRNNITILNTHQPIVVVKVQKRLLLLYTSPSSHHARSIWFRKYNGVHTELDGVVF